MPDLKIGDYIKLRGRKPQGIVYKISKTGWISVNWHPFLPKGPKYVHAKEVEIVPEPVREE